MILRRAITVGAAAAVAVLASQAGAFAVQYPPSSGTLTVSGSTVAAGGSVTISGSGCAAGGAVALQFDTSSAGSTTASGTGSFSASVTVPSGTSAGSHTITATCNDPTGAARVLSASVTVTSAGTAPLPRTGSGSSVPLALVGGALLLVGAVLAMAMYRRRSHASQM